VVSISVRNAWLKTFGACPATPSPGSARTAGTRTGLGTNERIRKSDPASLCWSQNYAAAKDAEGGKRAKSIAHRVEGRRQITEDR
jgi:hypothetical protein